METFTICFQNIKKKYSATSLQNLSNVKSKSSSVKCRSYDFFIFFITYFIVLNLQSLKLDKIKLEIMQNKLWKTCSTNY